MKVEAFSGNTRQCNFEYFKVREGPNYFVSFYKNSSRLHYDPKDCWRVLAQAKFTDTGKALKEWCLAMYEEYSLPQIEKWGDDHCCREIDDVGRADTSFASEAMAEEKEESDPTDNTKMIT